jgi:uncharacterized membrane protein
MKANSKITKSALEAIKGNWGTLILTYIVYVLISLFSSPVSLIVAGPLALGLATFNLSFVRGEEFSIEQLFSGFQNFGTAFGAAIMTAIFVSIGFFLLIIPGIVIAIMLSQVFYIIADNPELGVMDALKASREMMDGHKLQYFGLMIQFMLLSILCILTLGIGYFWLIPYMNITLAKFYEELAMKPVADFV